MKKTTWIATLGALGLLGFVALCALSGGGDRDPSGLPPATGASPIGEPTSPPDAPAQPESASRPASLPAVAAPRTSTYVELQLRDDARAEDIETLAALGARRVRATSRNRAIYEVADGAMERVQASPAVVAVRSPSVEEKMAYELREDLVLRDDDGLVHAEVYYLDGVSPESAEGIVSSLGLEILRHWPEERSLLVKGDLPALQAAASDDRVFQIWPDAGAPAAHNLDNAEISNVDRLWTSTTSSSSSPYVVVSPFGYNLSGSGVTVAQWDSGRVRSTHEALDHVTNVTTNSTSSHSTHVAGTMIASGAYDADAHGMAPDASLRAYDYTDGSTFAEFTSEKPNYDAGNNSWGYITGWDGTVWYGPNSNAEDGDFGKYTSQAATADENLESDNKIIIVSAGNDRNDTAPSSSHTHYGSSTTRTDSHPDDGADGGYDTLAPWGTAKNPICVGAIDENLSMSTFSNWGPTDDGRVKPDIVACGVDVYSCDSGSDSDYGEKNGTSMAAPTVTGSIALLIEYMRDRGYGSDPFAPSLSMTKALLAHTATDMGNDGPDYTYGWGLLDAHAAAGVIREDADAGLYERIKYHWIENGQVLRNSFDVTAGETIKLTLAWTDPAASGNTAGTDDDTPALVHDLDMIVIGPDGDVSWAWVLDPDDPSDPATTGDNDCDNIEQVYIASAPVSGTYYVFIRAEGAVGGNQRFAVVSEHDFITNFYEAPALSTPVALPTTGYVSTTCAYPTVSWTMSSEAGVAWYRILVNGSFADFASVGDTSEQIRLTSFGWKYWQVRAENPFQTGSSDSAWIYYYDADLEEPTNLSPTGLTLVTSLSSVRLTWDHVRSCDPGIQYRLFVWRWVNIGTATSPVWSQDDIVYGAITSNEYYSVSLPAKGEYHWMVQAILDGEYSSLTDSVTFTATTISR